MLTKPFCYIVCEHRVCFSFQVESPYCCEIDQLVLENAVTCFGFTFRGVPTEKMGGLRERVCRVIGELAGGEGRGLEMERMHTIIKKKILDILNQVSGRGRWRWGWLE